jgi:hypothetical protein
LLKIRAKSNRISWLTLADPIVRNDTVARPFPGVLPMLGIQRKESAGYARTGSVSVIGTYQQQSFGDSANSTAFIDGVLPTEGILLHPYAQGSRRAGTRASGKSGKTRFAVSPPTWH